MTYTLQDSRFHAVATVRASLAECGLAAAEPDDGVFLVELPGERRLSTPCRLVVGDYTLAVQAFVCRKPDENHAEVYRWLLSRNTSLYGVAFALNGTGDIYLTGRLPLAAVNTTEVDRMLGAVLACSDESFNTILGLGFASSIRREWEWRVGNGESTRNLEAFRGWLEHGEMPAGEHG